MSESENLPVDDLQTEESFQTVPSEATPSEQKPESSSNEPDAKSNEKEQLESVDLQGERLNVVAGFVPPPPSSPPPQHQQFPQGKVTITVSDPVNLGDSLKQHTNYKVTTTVTDEKEGVLHCAFQAQVERRYSDFLWLAEILRERFVGSLIPPLPEKKTLGRFDTETLQSRMKGFVSFLARCCSHPNKDIKQAPEFLVFLQGTQQELEALKSRTSKEHSSSEKFSRWISETVASLSSSKPNNPENDRYYLFAMHLEQVIEALHSNAEEKIKKTRGEALGWQDVSKSAQQLADYENKSANITDQSPASPPIAVPVESKEGLSSSSQSVLTPSGATNLGLLLARFANASEQIAKVTALRADNEHAFLSEPLQDLYNYCESVKMMIREKIRLETKYQENVTLLARQIQKLHTAKENRMQLQQQVDQLGFTVNDMQAKLNAATASIDEEMKRFNMEKEKEIKQALISFVKDQIENAKKTQEAWESLLVKM